METYDGERYHVSAGDVSYLRHRVISGVPAYVRFAGRVTDVLRPVPAVRVPLRLAAVADGAHGDRVGDGAGDIEQILRRMQADGARPVQHTQLGKGAGMSCHMFWNTPALVYLF